MVHTIQIKRGTRAQIEAARAAGQLKDGEPYLITDENRLAVGVAPNGYSSFAKDGNNTDITALTGLLGPLQTVEFIDFDLHATDADVTPTPGRLWYSTVDDSLYLAHVSGAVQQLGQEFFFPPTKNNSGSIIRTGDFVMATGAQGDKITIARAITNGSVDPMFMIGVATVDIPIGSEYGKIVTDGVVRDIDTSAFPIGTVIYPDPFNVGKFTSVRPTAPSIKTPIAIVLRQHANTGRIYVRMQTAIKLDEIQNVKIQNPVDGQVLAYNSTSGLWENIEIVITDEKVAVVPGGPSGYLAGAAPVIRSNTSISIGKDINDSFIELAVANVDFGTF